MNIREIMSIQEFLDTDPATHVHDDGELMTFKLTSHQGRGNERCLFAILTPNPHTIKYTVWANFMDSQTDEDGFITNPQLLEEAARELMAYIGIPPVQNDQARNN